MSNENAKFNSTDAGDYHYLAKNDVQTEVTESKPENRISECLKYLHSIGALNINTTEGEKSPIYSLSQKGKFLIELILVWCKFDDDIFSLLPDHMCP